MNESETDIWKDEGWMSEWVTLEDVALYLNVSITKFFFIPTGDGQLGAKESEWFYLWLKDI